MKKLTQLTLLLALVLGYSAQSQAALLIEPVIGYSFGKMNGESTTAGVTDKDDVSIRGLSYGGRLGYQNLGLQLGLDYLASSLDIDGENLKTSEFGGFVGFEFPILVRVYVGYIFSGAATIESDPDDIKYKGGTGPKVGVGFTLLPFLDINLEYRSISYEENDDFSPTTIEADYNAVMLGFSLPFTL